MNLVITCVHASGFEELILCSSRFSSAFFSLHHTGRGPCSGHAVITGLNTTASDNRMFIGKSGETGFSHSSHGSSRPLCPPTDARLVVGDVLMHKWIVLPEECLGWHRRKRMVNIAVVRLVR